MHEHMPSKHKSRLVTFLHLLISPRTVFTYYMDGADICGICNSYITVPYLYYSPVTKALYALFGVGLFFIVTRVSHLRYLLALVGAFLFHHIYSAAVFAFAPWDTYDPEIRNAASCAEEAKREMEEKFYWLMIGFLFPTIFFL